MKLATFLHHGELGAGYVEGDQIIICAHGREARGAVLSLVSEGPAAPKNWQAMAPNAPKVSLSEVSLLAPMPDPRRDIFCVGKNYRAHAAEFHGSGFDASAQEEVPSAPVVFTKATTSVVGPAAVVKASLDPTNSVDYEGELGVVIGRRAFQVSKDDAFDHVFGYVIVNDVTSRELQRKHNQWVIGKGVDTFCPMGPWLVTADEIDNVGAMELETRINGEIRQKVKIADLIFDIPSLIKTMTRTMTLLPGDVIATGTPVGVGIGFDPPKYLVPGDMMRVSITGLGALENPVG